MKDLKQSYPKSAVTLGKQRSYAEIIDFLDSNWHTNPNDAQLTCMKQLDKAFGSVSQKIPTILIGGTNGKSITMHYATKLLMQEGLSVGGFYNPHVLTYNERFVCNNEAISNKTFTDLGNDVLNTAASLGITPSSFEVLTMMALLYFQSHTVDVALLEVNESGAATAPALCNPKIVAITRVTDDQCDTDEQKTTHALTQALAIVKPGTHVVSANQSKIHLQEMQTIVENKGGVWAMPIRKVAPLHYPFEQLHGRCAALAERIADIYVNTFTNKDALVVSNSLLTKQKGRRGRPTLEAKRQSELNPKKTIDQFWKEEHGTLPARFQILDKEKPTVLLDNASNLDAFKNLLLGIRLMHYQRPLKGMALIIGGTNQDMDFEEFYKLLRYFFKKTSGQVIVTPVTPMPGQKGGTPWDAEAMANAIKGMKVKTKAAKDFKDAFESATKLVDDRHGLVVIAGSTSLVSEYWHYKGMKKLS
jgi:dihydrofolate synthase/folylpolyglutamate synthase